MRLHNMLRQPGGVSEQGQEITLRLRYAGPGGVPTVRDVVAVMLPVSETERVAAERAAEAAAAAKDAELPAGQEAVIQLLRVSLRDPGDLAQRLIEDETDLRALRAGLVGPQYDALLHQYQTLMRTEYPDSVSTEDQEALAAEARDFSSGGQPARG